MKMKLVRGGIIVLAVLVLLFVLNAAIGGWVSYNIKHYTSLTETNKILPKMSELGKYEKVKFKYYHDNLLMFHADAYILKVTYNDENYAKQKEALEEKYIYQTEWVSDKANGIDYQKEPAFEIDTFQMRLLSAAAYQTIYPHELIFVGVSDEANTIAYVYYIDDDLDYINCNFEEFLKRDCGW